MMAAFPEFWYHPSVVNFTFSLRVIVPLLPALLLALSNAYESPYQSPITSAHFSINHSRHKRGRDCAAGRPITASQLPLNLSASTSAQAWSVSSRLSLSLLLPPFVRPRAVLHRSDVVCVCLRAYGCSRAKNFHAVLDILTYYHVINIHTQLTYGPGIPFERSRDSTSVSI